MEAFLAYNYQPYVIEGSPATSEMGSPPAAEVMLAEFNPKKRAGRKKFKETRHPVYRGIRRRNADKWVCETREPNKKSRIWLGTFPTAEMAARAHDVASLSLRGASACLNFADSAWRLPVPASGDTKDIQRAAAEAAELFRPLSPMEAVEEEEEESEAADVAWEGDMSWMDEEVLGMREILAEMYNGMMVAPPPQEEFADVVYDYVEFDADLPLWTF